VVEERQRANRMRYKTPGGKERTARGRLTPVHAVSLISLPDIETRPPRPQGPAGAVGQVKFDFGVDHEDHDFQAV
jgi:hypothetical protein